AAPAQAVHLEAGDLKVDVRSVQRSPRLIGDLIRSREDDYLVLRLRLEAAPDKTVSVPIRASFAILSNSTPPRKYPVFSMGYFQPGGARPPVGTDGVSITSGGVTFSIAAEVPKSEKQFRLILQKPVAEVAIGEPQSLPSTAPVKPLGNSIWEGAA